MIDGRRTASIPQMRALLALAAPRPAVWLAATNRESDWAGDVWLWGGLLLAVAGVGFIVLLLVRRRFSGSGQGSSATWTLQDIRQMHASGLLTDEEYEVLGQRVRRSAGTEREGLPAHGAAGSADPRTTSRSRLGPTAR